MPVVKQGDRVTLSRTPLYSQISEWDEDLRISVFSPEAVFDVLSVNGSKVELRAINQSERRSFTWFKNAVSKILPPDPTAEDIAEEEESHVSLEDDDPARPCPSADISHVDLAELEAVAEEKEGRRVPTSIGIHANGKISVEYEEEEVPAAPPEPTGTPLEWAHTGEDFETPISTYKGLRYWIAGKRENGKKPSEMHYYIERNGAVTKSELHYCGVVFANRWAREAIDKLAVLQEVSP